MDEDAKTVLEKLRARGGELAVQVFAAIVSDLATRLDEVLDAADPERAFQIILAESFLSTITVRDDHQMRETILRHLAPSEVMDAVRRLRPGSGV